MKTILLILLMLFFMSCGGHSNLSNEELPDSSSSFVNISSTESISSSIGFSSNSLLNVGSSSSLQIDDLSSSINISSSVILTQSSSSVFYMSSSSSTTNKSSSVTNSSSSIAQNYSSEAPSSSNVYSSSVLSSSSAYRSELFLFDADSALGLEYYLTHNGETSPMYEKIANTIQSYRQYYGWNSIVCALQSASTSQTSEGFFILKSKGTIDSSGFIQDQVSPLLETITVQVNDAINLSKKNIAGGSSSYVFKSSEFIVVNGKKTFVLKRISGGYEDNSCNWFNELENKWVASGFVNGDASSRADYNSKCTLINYYVFR